ncbi:MAG: DUF3558 domain-containing protein [Rhodococcus sp.]|nr:DUF3558 domain-containing protein [Rhodococcus sp. (in: high G+C Gram-positive bacteria)]
MLVLVSVLAGCAADTESVDATASSESAASTTRVPRAVDDSGRPQVSFDPCLDIPDEALVEADYDPESEDSSVYSPGTHTFLSCSYNTAERRYGLNVMSGNITFAEEQERTEDSTPIEIDGHRALRKILPGDQISCAVSIETDYGILIVSRVIQRTSTETPPRSQWCDGIEETASIMARYLPGGE